VHDIKSRDFKQLRNSHEDIVRSHYDGGVEFTDARLDLYEIEFQVTLSYIRRYLRPPDKLLDVACGTGRYAEVLLKEGLQVGMSDLSSKLLMRAMERVGRNPGVTTEPLFARVGNALRASSWQGGPWDGALLLGPMYHLLEREERLSVLSLARKNIKRNGYLFASFIPRMAAVWDGLARWPEGIFFNKQVDKLMQTGKGFNFARDADHFPGTYFCEPQEISPMLEEAGFSVLHLAGTEGPFGGRVARFHELLPPRLKTAWKDFVIRYSDSPEMVMTSEHILAVGKAS